MNPMLLQLLAARAGSTGNTQLADAMARLNSGEATPVFDPQELLARYGNDNPAVNLLIQQMTARAPEGRQGGRILEGEVAESSYEGAEELDEGLEEEEAEEFAVAESTTEVLDELRREIAGVVAQLATLEERNNLLAAALGACPFCWGENARCVGCRGRGRAGFSMPDEELFREYVAPAVRTLRALKSSFRTAPN